MRTISPKEAAVLKTNLRRWARAASAYKDEWGPAHYVHDEYTTLHASAVPCTEPEFWTTKVLCIRCIPNTAFFEVSRHFPGECPSGSDERMAFIHRYLFRRGFILPGMQNGILPARVERAERLWDYLQDRRERLDVRCEC